VKYREDVKSLEDFTAKLRNKPDDINVLLQALMREDGNADEEFYGTQAIPFSSKSDHTPQLDSKSTVVSGSVKYTGKGQQVKTSTSIRVSGKQGGTSVGCESSQTIVKQDLNGNLYVYVPGQGWVNPACLSPSGWLLFFLWSLFTHNWILFYICISLAAWHYNRGHESGAN